MADLDRATERTILRCLRNASVMRFLDNLGLTNNNTAEFVVWVNPRLLELACERAGVETDSHLIELALGNLVMEDGFPDAFRASRGTVSLNIDLES